MAERDAGPVLVAPDAVKGTMSAAQVAAAVARGVRRAGVQAVECPVADGGEGTIEILHEALGGELRASACHDPLGRRIVARWLWMPGPRTAIVEMAQCSGLVLVAEAERDAEAASSAGTGELLIEARDAGALETIVTVGGTATSDGGAGALEAIARGGGLGAMALTIACDVAVPFERAAEVFGPQKGADPAAVARLTSRLHDLAAQLPRDPRGMPMTGAAGGLAGGLWATCGARLLGGADFVLAALDFDERMAGCSAIVVGEGRLDAQSRIGKITGEILERAAARGLPVHAIVGSAEEGAGWRELASLQLAGSVPELEAAGSRVAAL